MRDLANPVPKAGARYDAPLGRRVDPNNFEC